LLLVPGVEVSTADGHLLVYGVRECPPVGRPLAETIDWVYDHAGVPVVAHPYRVPHGVGRRLAEVAHVPALEAANGHNSEFANAKADLLAARRRIGATGGSDSHTPEGVGRAYTAFAEDVTSVESVLEQLRHGRCHGSGRSLTGAERFLVPLKSAGLRIGRGFRPV
jgi:predicted metal-dependent phosphoesterase TrpH